MYTYEDFVPVDIKEQEAKEMRESLEYRKLMLPKLVEMQLLAEQFPYRFNLFNDRSNDLMELLDRICGKLEARFNAELKYHESNPV